MSAFASPPFAKPQEPQTGRYQWQGYQCTFEAYQPPAGDKRLPALLLVHPIGVGLARPFWHRFCAAWQQQESSRPIYNPDLLGCGGCDMPQRPYRPADWAQQLLSFLQVVVKQPVVLVVQGALLPVAIELTALPEARDWVRGLVLSGPPAWSIVTRETPQWQQNLSWRLFDSPLGNAFYRYARREQFLQSFSQRKLFASQDGVDDEWLAMLEAGSQQMRSRYAVFAFLAGFWRQNYEPQLRQIQQPTYVVFGEAASSIDRNSRPETARERLTTYLTCLPHSQGAIVPGRNVLPYENTRDFVRSITPFIQTIA